MLRPWALPVVFGLLAVPSVSQALRTCAALLAGATIGWDAVLLDMAQAVLMITVALAALSLRGRSPARPLWLLGGGVLARVGRMSDRA